MKFLAFLNNGTDVPIDDHGDVVKLRLSEINNPDIVDAIVKYIHVFCEVNTHYYPKIAMDDGGYDDVTFATLPRLMYNTINFDMIGNVESVMCGLGSRRPAYQIRGAKITEDQAFNVIANSDEVFIRYVNDCILTCATDDKDLSEDAIIVRSTRFADKILNMPYGHIANQYLIPANCLWYTGYVLPDGTVGCNHWSYKYPEYFELYMDVLAITMRFPFLRFAVAVPDWDERCPAWWDYGSSRYCEPIFIDTTEDLERDLKYCLYAHDGKVEIQNDLKQYKEFESQYEDKRVFEIEDYYNEVLKQNLLSKEYVQRILQYHHLESRPDFVEYVTKCYEGHYKF